MLQGDSRLGVQATKVIASPENELHLSAASYWEICIKVSIGKLALRKDWMRLADREMEWNGIAWLPVRKEHALGVVDLPFHHRDPFDRLLVAQAKVEKLTMLSADSVFHAYGIPVVWG
jgi:PIN domain nuclease of toxin-antitoxin system